MTANPPTTAVSTAAYHSSSRSRIDLAIDHVPHPPAGGDQLPAELLADVRHVDLDQVRQRVVGLVENVVVDLRLRDHLPAAGGEQLQDRVLAGGQHDRRAVLRDGPLAGVDDHPADLDP